MSALSSLWSGVLSIPRKMFGSRNERLLKVYRRQLAAINAWEAEIRGDYDALFSQRSGAIAADLPLEEREDWLHALCVELSADLRERAADLRRRITPHVGPIDDWWWSLTPQQRTESHYRLELKRREGRAAESMDGEGVTAEAIAVIREASRRARNHRHFDCQLIGGRVLYEGKIAEMRTGEGKTIVCHIPAFLKFLSGRKVHVITVNDYLVKRDAEFARSIFALVGATVGFIQSQVDPGGHEGIRRAAYSCDITYGTNSEFGFDYLRDNMKVHLSDQVQGRLDFAIVDEVDSILIDEARTPLIISGPARDDVTRYPRADRVARELVKRQVVWDRKILETLAVFDGDARNIPKFGDAMKILGFQERGLESRGKKSKAKAVEAAPQQSEPTSNEPTPEENLPTLGPDFLTDDHVEAIQTYQSEMQVPTTEQYRRFYIVQTEHKKVGITHEGVTVAQEQLELGSLYSGANMEWPHLIENALRAHKVYQRDRDYVVHDGQIVIVDVFTGRLMHGRQWSDGLHQAIEAKEMVRVKEETQTLATITIQNFVKLYLSRAGMTGTAYTEAMEFDKIYGLDVVEIPTNRPVNRIDHNDKMYRDVEGKYQAIVDEVHEVHRRGRPADPFVLADVLTALRPLAVSWGKDVAPIDEALKQFNDAKYGDRKVISFMLQTHDDFMGDLAKGRPVLVGTTSVENSEKLSRLLTSRYNIDHEVLNAKNHSREAEIVAKAGYTSIPLQSSDSSAPRGHVTIATNMAGRGTDIKLGPGVVHSKCKVPDLLPIGVSLNVLYPPGVTKCCIHCDEYDPETNCAHCFKPKLDPRFPAMGRTVCPIGVPCGLHIIGTERHEARRIDNQLRGRSGRQGDPGSSRFSLSLADDLLKLFMPDWMLRMMDRLSFTEGASLEDKHLNKGIERAQKKVEERNFSTRKQLLEWDEPMDFQRKEFYAIRQTILEERDLETLIFDTINNEIRSTVQRHMSKFFVRTCIGEWCRTQLALTIDDDAINIDDFDATSKSIRNKARDEAHDQIRTSLGEYLDVEEPAANWDVAGLASWAQRAFGFSVSQNQLRKMTPNAIEDALMDAADAHCEELDLSAAAVYLRPRFPLDSLAEWARSKFTIDVQSEELSDKSAPDVIAMLGDRVRSAYREREIRYPVESCIERAFGVTGTDSAASADLVVKWAHLKFRADWTVAEVQGKPVQEIYERLLATNREFFGGRLEKEIHGAATGKSQEEVVEWARQRFGPTWKKSELEQADGELLAVLLSQGRKLLRWELTRLEQFVLLRIYDQAWKDHLLEMDHLKTAIMQRPLGGDQTHPQSQFAIEGRDVFAQMWTRIAERVTDVIFKVRESSPAEANAERARPSMTTVTTHADSTNAGFAMRSADQDAAMKAQNVEQKVEQIRRETPRVGRNEPCPCGSGKKYKQCHGK